ncbi:MAG: D-cysteine desulfhydrase family protein [Anaerolineaceae bacterium]|nr:D-cysteine desulfhydrase family protein [Anaerolineaceae bacterium]
MIKRYPLAYLPTPIEALPGLTKFLGGPQFFVKRDDLTGLGIGGNKTRKLEYLLADALEQGCKTLMSTGAVQSNHCRQVAAAAAKAGLACILVLAGDEPEERQGNLLLDYLSGAETIFVKRAERDQRLRKAFEEARQAGKKPYLIPYGGSSAVGALGYLEAMRELMAQGLEADWIIFPSSSGGTHAGMALGAKLSGFKGRVLGIGIDKLNIDFKETISQLANQTSRILEFGIELNAQDILLNEDYCQAGYGVLQACEVEAIKLFASKDAILLDPVYTGRAAAGMLDLARKGFFKANEKVLFWHTGGTPALFAEPYQSMLGR